MRSIGWVSALGTLLTAGCVAVLPAPPRRIAMLTPLGARIFSKTVAAGTTAMLNTATSVNPDCTVTALPTSRITQEPVHGIVRFVQEGVFPSYRPNDPRARCNGMRVPGIVAEYTPAAGFVGADFAILEFIFKDGRDVQLKYAITVK